MSKDSITYTITGKAHYAKVLAPVENKFKEGELRYEMGVTVSEGDIKNLEDLGISEQVINPSAGIMQSRYKMAESLGAKTLTVRRTARYDDDGKLINAVAVVGPDGQTAVTEKIGNGSEVNVQVFVNSYTNRNTGKEAKKLILGAVQVVDLIPFEAKTGFQDLTKTKGEVI